MSSLLSRRGLTDGMFLVSAEIGSRLVAFCVTFVVAHRLGLNALALLTLAQSLISFATIASDAGLGSSAVTRMVHGEPRDAVIAQTAVLQVWSGVAATLVVAPIIASRVGFELLLAVSLLPVAAGASTTYVLIAGLQQRRLAIARVLGNVSTGIIGAGAALVTKNISFVASSYAIGAIITMVAVNRWSNVSIGSIFSLPKRSAFGSWGVRNLWLALLTLVVQASSVVVVVGAGILAPNVHLAASTVATRVITLALIPAGIVRTILLPRYSVGENLRVVFRDAAFLGVLGALLAIFIWATAPFVMPRLFGADVRSSLPAIYWSLPTVPLSFSGAVLATALLARVGYRRALACCATGLGAAVIWLVATRTASTSSFVCANWVGEGVTLILLALGCRGAVRDSRASGNE